MNILILLSRSITIEFIEFIQLKITFLTKNIFTIQIFTKTSLIFMPEFYAVTFTNIVWRFAYDMLLFLLLFFLHSADFFSAYYVRSIVLKKQSEKIVLLWSQFYVHTQKTRYV